MYTHTKLRYCKPSIKFMYMKMRSISWKCKMTNEEVSPKPIKNEMANAVHN